MSVNFLSFAEAGADQIQKKESDPAYRKATRKMILSSAAFAACVLPMIDIFETYKSSFGLVVGSVIGELESTRDFLVTLDKQKLARPLLFQHSLHNSTSGMLALQYGITGPVITTSHPTNVAKDSLEIADLLLSSDMCSFVVIVNVETDAKILGYQNLPEGAHAILVASDSALERSHLPKQHKRILPINPIGYEVESTI